MNSLGHWADHAEAKEPPLPLDGPATHWDHRVADDHWQQPGNLFRLMGLAQRQALYDNTACSLGAASPHIQRRHIDNCTKADPAYGAGVAKALGLDVSADAAE